MEPKKSQQVKELLKKENVAQAQKIFNEIPPENTVDYWLLKGKIEQKFQNWGEALNAFSSVLEIDDHNQAAKNNIHIIQNILNFWNPEMFNP